MKRPELRLLRDAIEAVLSPELATAAIDEALHAMPNGLMSEGEVIALVDGPLRAALRRRHGDAADDVIDDLVAVLVERPPMPQVSSYEVTREVPLEAARVFVFVFSSAETIGGELERTLGTQAVAAVTFDDPDRVRKAITFKTPAIVVVDGVSFPTIEPSQMPTLLAGLPPTTVRAVWGTDTPYGASVVAGLTARRATFTPLDRREGIAPILDLVRARRSAP